MRFSLIAVGRIKDHRLRSLADDYLERINRYIRLEVTEVKEGSRTSGEPSGVADVEGAAVIRALPENTLVIVTTRTGRSSDSMTFAKTLDGWCRDPRRKAFIIGGPFGVGPAVLDRADHQVSLSSFTLPHELARVVLLEQIYRACSISAGEPYHKGTSTRGRK